jgi:hypothetical protein
MGGWTACRSPRAPARIAVVFDTAWRFESLSDGDQVVVKRAALATLRQAFEGFDVVFADGRAGERTIRVEETPYASDARQLIAFGAVGLTYPGSAVSSVRHDVLFNAELAAVRCARIDVCGATRAELLEGFGRGIGATAAHELGHQAGFGFSRDVSCADCYDGRSSLGYAHFFGVKHWSDDAVRRMRRVLPRK